MLSQKIPFSAEFQYALLFLLLLLLLLLRLLLLLPEDSALGCLFSQKMALSACVIFSRARERILEREKASARA